MNNKQTELDQLTRGYIRAMLWSTNGTTPEGEEVDSLEDYDLSPEALGQCNAACLAFYTANYGLLCEYVEHKETSPEWGTAWDYAGHDLWLTRAGHGVGFFDRTELPQHIKNGLTATASALCYAWPYIGDDQLVYI